MKKLITFILMTCIITTIFCSCGKSNKKGINDTITTDSLLSEENTSVVEQEHIDFILNRKVFIPECSTLYRSAIADYDSKFNTNITFGDLINEKFFDTSTIKWDYHTKENDVILVSFAGCTKKSFADIPIVVGFGWTRDAKQPLVAHVIFGSDSNGKPNEWSTETIQNKYQYDIETAFLMCDATFSCMLASALLDSSDSIVSQNNGSPNISLNTKNKESEPAEDSIQENNSTVYEDNMGNLNKTQQNNGDKLTVDDYYVQAVEAYDEFIQERPYYSYYGTRAYEDAKEKLSLCNGYKDSSTKIQIIDCLYNADKEIGNPSSWNAEFSDMEVKISDSKISIIDENFMSGRSGHLNLNVDVKKKTFTASISHVFAPNMRHYRETKVVAALIALFSGINDTYNLNQKLQDESSWKITDDNEKFTISYNGYNISINVVPEEYGYVNSTISVYK